MKVILREDIQGLGHSGDLVEVREGYGRNYLLPRNLAVLANEKGERGNYTITWNAAVMASGVYFCRMTAGDYTDVKRMVLVR